MLTLPTPGDLKAQRARLGLTQAQLAEAAGVSQSLIARIEGGKVDPSYSTLRAVVEALNEAERREAKLLDLMTAPVTSVTSSTPVRQAVAEMQKAGFSQLPVVDDGAPVGSLGEKEVVHALTGSKREDLVDLPVGELMGPPFPAVEPGASIESALRLLEDRAAVMVMEKGRVIGIVTKSDLLHTLE